MFKKDSRQGPAWGIEDPLKRKFLAGLCIGIAIGIAIGRLLGLA